MPETLIKPVETTKKTDWVALIYLPGNEIESVTNDLLISGIRPTKRIPFYRAFQFIDPDTSELRSIRIHPGTNIGYHVLNSTDGTEKVYKLPVKVFDAIFSNPLNSSLVDKSIKKVYPITTGLDGIPRYCDFGDEDALLLVQNHTHEKWIDFSLVGENRVAVKTLAEQRKLQIIEHRRKLQEGLV